MSIFRQQIRSRSVHSRAPCPCHRPAQGRERTVWADGMPSRFGYLDFRHVSETAWQGLFIAAQTQRYEKRFYGVRSTRQQHSSAPPSLAVTRYRNASARLAKQSTLVPKPDAANMLDHLFPRAPVLPADPSVSVAQYCSSVRATVADAKGCLSRGDPERASLLFMRCMQLICKTLPSHPEYAILENKAIIRELARLADVCLSNLEHVAAKSPEAARSRLFEPGISALYPSSMAEEEETTPFLSPPFSHRRPHPVEVATEVVDVLQRMGAEACANGDEVLGVLATKIPAPDDKTATKGSDPDGLSVSAMIVPSQCSTGETQEAVLMYESDLHALFAAKRLTQIGWILLQPREDPSGPPRLDSLAAHLQAALQARNPDAFILIARLHEPSAVDQRPKIDVQAVRLRDPSGLERVFECGERFPHTHSWDSRATRDEDSESSDDSESESAAEERLVLFADHVEIKVGSRAPAFKIYDLRPMAAVHGRGTG